MEEVEIPPRDVFCHYVSVPSLEGNPHLMWWFNTKKRNVAFGLFHKPGTFLPGSTGTGVFRAADPTATPRTSGFASGSTESALGLHGTSKSPDAPERPHSIDESAGEEEESDANSFIQPSGSIPIGSTSHRPPSALNISGCNSSSSSSSQHPPNLIMSPAKRVRTTPVGPLLNDPDLVEVSPVSYYETAKSTIKGQYAVQAPGTYVFVFDNTFSRNTSKRLTFFVALKSVASSIDTGLISPVLAHPHSTHPGSPTHHPDPTSPKAYPFPATSTRSRRPSEVSQMLTGGADEHDASSRTIDDGSSHPEGATPPVEGGHSGWVLKKKRKKMQGWARRHLVLDRGVLSYAKTIGGRPRGSIPVALATIAISPSRLLINVDSGLHLYQLRMASKPDFEAWVNAIQTSKRSAGLDLASRLGADHILPPIPDDGTFIPGGRSGGVSMGKRSARASEALRVTTLRQHAEFRFGQAAESAIVAYDELNSAIDSEMSRMASSIDEGLTLTDPKLLPPPPPTPSHISMGSSIDGGGKERKGLRIPGLGKRSQNAPPPPAAEIVEHPGTLPSSSANSIAGSSIHATSPPASDPHLHDLLHRLSHSLYAIREEQAKMRAVQLREAEQRARSDEYARVCLAENAEFRRRLNIPEGEAILPASTSGPPHFPPSSISPHPSTDPSCRSQTDGLGVTSGGSVAGPPSADTSGSIYPHNPLHVRSMSIISGLSVDDMFFDASEDVLIADDSSSDEDDDTASFKDPMSASTITTATANSSTHPPASTSTSAPTGSSSPETILPTPSSVTAEIQEEELAKDPGATPIAATLAEAAAEGTFRTALPAPVSGAEISLLSIMRKNMGKDLSQVAMPVALNEPLNLLQRLCEELEYSHLLDHAVALPSPTDRLAHVAAFAVSGYASSQYRASRKPFNPLLGETYECISPERGFRFIAEKVSHHPPVMACHAESPKGWVFRQANALKSKFWGKSMEMSSAGDVHIEFPALGEHYTIAKPTTWMRNIVGGTRYLEHCGELRVTSHATGEVALLTFKEAKGGGFFSSASSAPNKNEVIGKILSRDGTTVSRTVHGRWTDYLALLPASAYAAAAASATGPPEPSAISAMAGEVVWTSAPPAEDHAKYYGFTPFAISLNGLNLPDPSRIAPTDTRFRPDQRAFENGDVDTADKLKVDLEAAQRARRKDQELSGTAYSPEWFSLATEPVGADGSTWVYKGGYWEARSNRSFPSESPLW